MCSEAGRPEETESRGAAWETSVQWLHSTRFNGQIKRTNPRTGKCCMFVRARADADG